MTGLLTQPSPTFVTNERGGPVPPQDILKRLAQVDPSLGLRFMADFDASRWALTWEWKPSDVRWARVQVGEIPREAAYDIIGYLPLQCPVEQAAAYVETHLKNYPREEVSKLRAQMTHWNDVEMPAQQVQALVADTLEDVGKAKGKKKGKSLIITPS